MPKADTHFEHDIRAGRQSDGMTFNQKVWALTSRIPRGRVTTYAELAKAMGGTAYRAIGNAMNKNPYAPGVPCHRVVGSDRSLTGYAFGLPKKRALLIDEGVPCSGTRAMVDEIMTAEELLGLPKRPAAKPLGSLFVGA